MRRWRIEFGMLIAVSLPLEQSCWFRREPRKASIVLPPIPQPGPPQPIASPPKLAPGKTAPSNQTSQTIPNLPAPIEPPAKPKVKPPRKSAPVVVATAPPAETLPPDPASAAPSAAPLTPALQPILGTEEINERNKKIQRYLEKARVQVLRAERRKPNAQQKLLIEQVRTFVQQAEEARKVDLVRAENLAERAEVLARGLDN